MSFPEDFNKPVPGPHYYYVRYTDGTLGFVTRCTESGRQITAGDRWIDPIPYQWMDYVILKDMGVDDGSEFFMAQLDKLGAIAE